MKSTVRPVTLAVRKKLWRRNLALSVESGDGAGYSPLDCVSVIAVVFLLKHGLLQGNFVAFTFANRDDEEGYRDNEMRDKLVDLDEDEQELPHEAVRCENVDAIAISASKIVVEIDVEPKHKGPKQQTGGIGHQNDLDLMFPFLDVVIANALEGSGKCVTIFLSLLLLALFVHVPQNVDSEVHGRHIGYKFGSKAYETAFDEVVVTVAVDGGGEDKYNNHYNANSQK
jgi:hypothetical protein